MGPWHRFLPGEASAHRGARAGPVWSARRPANRSSRRRVPTASIRHSTSQPQACRPSQRHWSTGRSPASAPAARSPPPAPARRVARGGEPTARLPGSCGSTRGSPPGSWSQLGSGLLIPHLYSHATPCVPGPPDPVRCHLRSRNPRPRHSIADAGALHQQAPCRPSTALGIGATAGRKPATRQKTGKPRLAAYLAGGAPAAAPPPGPRGGHRHA